MTVARKTTVNYTAFNIRTHPHSPDTYVKLMNKAFELKRQIKLRGDTFAILKKISPLKGDAVDGITGEIAKFTRIESGKWFNLNELRAAEEDETKQIVIPEALRPNFTDFYFVFYPKNHFLIIECKDKFGQISPKYLEVFFNKLFDSEEIIKEFNKVEVTLVPSTDQLESVLSLTQINTLEIVIRRPNTDGLEDLEDEVLDRLNNQNAEEEVITLKAQKGLSIDADNETKGLSHVAQLNGVVKTAGLDGNGKRAVRSTQQHPFVESGQYVSGEISARDFLITMADGIIGKIRRMARSQR
jgi:hypothetical protein